MVINLANLSYLFLQNSTFKVLTYRPIFLNINLVLCFYFSSFNLTGKSRKTSLHLNIESRVRKLSNRHRTGPSKAKSISKFFVFIIIIIILLFYWKIPVSTRRRFDVHTASITLKRSRMDVKTTLCAYWDSTRA